MAELQSDARGLVGDDALCERERLRLEDVAKTSVQRMLPLGALS
ncbi:MAG: hypothetical protein ABIO17_06905 [Pseudoxanthomonas sp.]